VGNPLGELAYTMTRGMISALDRDITTQDSSTGESKTVNMFQFDAAVNNGNSGGPVYNEYGEVIGVVTAKYSNTGVEGLGFGIPMNDAVEIANELIEHGYVSGKAYMGISVQTVSSEVARYYNMVEGAYVYTVDSMSCAAKAGLQMGDIITAIDGKEIKTSSDLVSAKKKYKAGDTAKLTVYRGGKSLELSITFDEDKNTAAQNSTESGSQQNPGNRYGSFGGYGFNW
jgi:serine protease Do